MLEIERKLLLEHIKEVGIARLLFMYLLVIIFIIVVEAFASFNIYILEESQQSTPILRDVFSITAITVAVFTVIANAVFAGSGSKHDRDFHYYFRIRPLMIYSVTAIVGDIIAVALAGRTSYIYVVFFTSMIALSLFSIVFAVHTAESTFKHRRLRST
jgi:hypothetical protein